MWRLPCVKRDIDSAVQQAMGSWAVMAPWLSLLESNIALLQQQMTKHGNQDVASAMCQTGY
jgi:hypothetical protein